MFREMRRSGQLLDIYETEAILESEKVGTLGVTGDDGYPYVVPLNYVYEDGNIYIHCAPEGHKIDSVRRNDRVSFCVAGVGHVMQEKFTMLYKSAIVFGRAEVLRKPDEKRKALRLLVRKYSPKYQEEGDKVIEESLDHVCVLKIHVEKMTGKGAKYLVSGGE